MIKCDFILFQIASIKFYPFFFFSPGYFKVGARLLEDVLRGLMTSLDNPLDFHSKIFSVLPIFLKYLSIG